MQIGPCNADRGVASSADVEDIKGLAREIGLTTAQEALELVTTFYPDRIIEPKTRFGLEQIFDRLLPGRQGFRHWIHNVMNARSRRPRSIYEVSVRTRDGTHRFDVAPRELLDTLYSNPEMREAALAARPVPRTHGVAVPEWSEHHGRNLMRPFFAGGLKSLRARLTVESPAAFCRRLLFVSKNALSRPRTPQDLALGE
jgi:hypothetical protein